MRRSWRILVVTTFLAAGCGGTSAPTAPVVPVVPACQANNTASVAFGNRSANFTYTVSWDGLTAATLAPGATSTAFDTAAGVAHQLIFRYANTNVLACATSNPIPTTCGTPVYTCSF